MAQRYILDRIADDGLRVYVIWAPLFDTDDQKGAERATILVSDPRVTHFWAEGLALAEAYKAHFGLQKSVAWDVFLAFPAGATWKEPVPAPSFFMHSLSELPADRRLNGSGLAVELEKLLGKKGG